ncbi:MAG: TIGR03557 family F420-dependent LLM class oxidoreductase, partial [Actinomycetota bacterium]|nr:TIGR03557 family F420-dependent LLM class oxidoreductase [Actinomycetota bacterium]
MAEMGYVLSSEETSPNDMVHNARRAEEVGFTTAWISDHYHPWIDEQGQSPFVWSVIGGIAATTERIRLGTGVTCPTIRIHPAIIAQATATSAAMMEGRFWFGIGSGENLNEHILGDHWPPTDIRLEMMEEAVHVIRLLWEGGNKRHYGKYYTVENARLYTLPDEPPPIYVSAFGPKAIEVAARIGDGYVGTAPEPDLLSAFTEKAGEDKPCLGEMKVCWHEDEREA